MKKSTATKAAGTLYVVATPIGNYDDITLRGLQALKDCDVIVCEEEQEARRLLHHYDIEKEIIELNEHNDAEASVECMKLLTKGKTLALISDAGTPLLADPGDILVKAAVAYKVDVRVLPGASSVLAALVRSTHSAKQFVYAGFLSRKNEDRDAEIVKLAREARTIVLMDTPYRLKTVLAALAGVMPTRQAYIGCNLTMTTETHHYGTLEELHVFFEENKFRGEYVIVIEGNPDADADAPVLAQAPSMSAAADAPPRRGRGRQPMTERRDEASDVPAGRYADDAEAEGDGDGDGYGVGDGDGDGYENGYAGGYDDDVRPARSADDADYDDDGHDGYPSDAGGREGGPARGELRDDA
ncbi:MAG: 16S rRNA (cytidine(1402)-2'-O)-methyltransferase, partial [Candidatus Kapaibacterium sp.]